VSEPPLDAERNTTAPTELPSWRDSGRAAWAAFWPSRLVVFAVAIWVTVADLNPNWPPEETFLAHPFKKWPASGLLDILLSPLAKWDALHYLAITVDGYSSHLPGLTDGPIRPAFFPLYPGIVRVLSGFAASQGLVLIVAYVVSLACFFGALMILHRLISIEVGMQFARPALMLLAFFPAAFFFGIPYTESLFLLIAVGAFYAARTGHWTVAGVLLALASATRAPGILLVVPVALLYLYGPRDNRPPDSGRTGWWPRYSIRPDVAWLLLAPVGLIAYSVYLHFALGNATIWEQVQSNNFGRETIDPFTGAWHAVREAGRSVGHILDGSYAEGARNEHLDILNLSAVVFALIGGIGCLRMLPPAYGAWVLVSLVPSFVSQPEQGPLYSVTRFVSVLFPLFIWLAVVCERRRATTTVIALFAAGMAVLTAEFTLWSFVA
jgi:hypothetical protein